MSAEEVNKVCCSNFLFQSRRHMLTGDQACGYELASKHEGQQTLTILLSADLSESQIEANILAHFKDRGVYALEHQPSNIADTLHWIVEFDDADPAWVTDLMDKGWILVGYPPEKETDSSMLTIFCRLQTSST